MIGGTMKTPKLLLDKMKDTIGKLEELSIEEAELYRRLEKLRAERSKLVAALSVIPPLLADAQ
jgi:hypothetical protein